MNRYYKLQNGDIYDNWTKSTICRDYLMEILNRGYKIINHDSNSNTLDPDWKKFIDRATDSDNKKLDLIEKRIDWMLKHGHFS